MAEHRSPFAERSVAFVSGLRPAVWQWIDVVVAGGLLVGLALPLLLDHPSNNDHPAAILALGALAALPLSFRRRWPILALSLVATAAVVAAVVDVRMSPFDSNATPALALAMYMVAVRAKRRTSLYALGVVLVGTFTAGWIATSVHSNDVNAVHTVAALGGWFIGDTERARRAYRRELEEQRRREADERTRRALAEERLQISRELHDVISHNLTVIAVRSGIGRMLFDTEPDEARQALVEAESMSRSALAELRRLLSALRDDASLGPAPKISDIPQLIEQVTASGLPIEYNSTDVDEPLGATLELSAYRIVQEALTNVVKHAGNVPTIVTLRLDAQVLTIEVVNAGEALAETSLAGAGLGLAGMRERVAVFGGTVEAGPRADGGFRVTARLPLDEPAAVA